MDTPDTTNTTSGEQQDNLQFNSEVPVQSEAFAAKRYENLHEIGKGGMGVVYKATDRENDQTVAIKIIRGTASNNTVEMAAQLEAEAAKTVPGLFPQPYEVLVDEACRSLDIGGKTIPEDSAAIVMELIEGESLMQMLGKEHSLSGPETVLLIEKIASKLEECAAAGIRHGDISLNNIFVRPDGGIVFIDLGLSSLVVPRIHGYVGTLPYIPPERLFLLKKEDSRSDVFILGLITYELLLGHRMRDGVDVFELMAQIDNSDHLMQQIDNNLGVKEKPIIKQAIQFDPNQRYQTPSEFAQALKDALSPSTN